MNNKSSKFIVLEGLDGTGKSTQIDLLSSYFEKKYLPHHFIHFPRTANDSPVFGEMVASFLRGDFGDINNVHPELVALIYAGDRYNASVELKELLKNGKNIIADRYVFSNIAYQCAKINNIDERKILMKKIFEMEYNYFKIPVPDISIFLHVPISFVENKLKSQRTGNDRDYLKGKEDIHEKDINFQKSVEDVYLSSCENMPDNLKYLNCINEKGEMKSISEIHKGIVEILKKNFII